jgi:dienelactone hydrolase
MHTHSFEIAGSAELPIRGDLHLPAGDGPHPVAVGVHGFKGFRNWGFWPHIAAGLAVNGVACLRFDMSHNGVGAGGLEFDEEELFERNTWAREEEDLGCVLDALRTGSLPGAASVDTSRLGLIGHSRGGGLVVVRSAQDSGVRATVSLAAVAKLSRFPDEVMERGRAKGFIPILNTRTGQTLRFGRDAIAEIDARPELHDLASHYASRIQTPYLVCHGTADTGVSPDDARCLAAAAPNARLELFEGADHVLDCRHPWQGSTPHLARFVELASQHFLAHL